MFAKDLYNKVFDNLKTISTEPSSETNLILEKVFNISKMDIAINKTIDTKDKSEYLENVLTQRLSRIPLQYIFNEQPFRSYNFYVDSRVLIPRPETELLVDVIIDICKNNFHEKEQIKIVDVGTGSGAIAISLALEIKNSIVYTVDISEKALEVAKINSEKLNVPKEKLFFIHGDKLENLINQKFDIIVSNPPYIPYKEYINLEKEVLDNEPESALLDHDEEGLGFYKYFSEESYKFLMSNGFIAFEVGYNQAEKVSQLLLSQTKFANIEIIKDYSGIPRIVTARQKNENFTG